ncbi:MAG: CoA-binding protein [Bacteroidetes bacterium]|nr:CoA-binding protein [Bacteroidota bacterium]
MKATKESINGFLSLRKIAIAGASRDKKKFGYAVMEKLKKAGIDIYPVNPNTDVLHGEPCYRSIDLLPEDIDGLLVLTAKAETPGVVEATIKKGIRNIWIQQMSQTPEAIQLAEAGNVNLVTGQCILMHAEPVDSIHKFHRAIKKFFGGLPK